MEGSQNQQELPKVDIPSPTVSQVPLRSSPPGGWRWQYQGPRSPRVDPEPDTGWLKGPCPGPFLHGPEVQWAGWESRLPLSTLAPWDPGSLPPATSSAAARERERDLPNHRGYGGWIRSSPLGESWHRLIYKTVLLVMLAMRLFQKH